MLGHSSADLVVRESVASYGWIAVFIDLFTAVLGGSSLVVGAWLAWMRPPLATPEL